MTSALQLTRYDGQDGIEILINQNTGESYCSVKGYARMSGKDQSTIRERLRNVTSSFGMGGDDAPEMAESTDGQVFQMGGKKNVIHRSLPSIATIETSQGLKEVRLITEDQIVEWLPKDNPIAASALLKMGVRMALHKMAGYSVSTTATNATLSNPIDIQIRRALSLAGSPGVLAVETFKMLNGLSTAHDVPTTAHPPKPASYACFSLL